MEKFIGTKVIKADPAPKTWSEHYAEQGWDWPVDKEGSDRLGYTVGYPEADGTFSGKLKEGCQYISWSPADVFEAAYKPMTGMSFGLAIDAMKAGYKVARAGWNGKNMFVVYQKGYPDGIPCNAQTAKAFGINEGDLFKCRPYFQLRCADGSHQMWQPDVSDCLEDDWMVV